MKKPKDYEVMVKAFRSSPYFMSARGCRDTSPTEIMDVFKILCESETPLKDLKKLYENHPDTIAMVDDPKRFLDI